MAFFQKRATVHQGDSTIVVVFQGATLEVLMVVSSHLVVD
jgi:hypothetical protein